jgi:hypothetical protein
MIEGSGSIPLTSGIGSGSRRPPPKAYGSGSRSQHWWMQVKHCPTDQDCWSMLNTDTDPAFPSWVRIWIIDNLTKFIWVKNYTKTHKKWRIKTTTQVYTREKCTAKIHEEWVKNPPNSSGATRDGYIRQPCTQLGLTRLADFATPQPWYSHLMQQVSPILRVTKEK